MQPRLVQLGARPIRYMTKISRQGPLKSEPALHRSMSSSSTHAERTAAEQRDNAVHLVKLNRIEPVNETVKLLQLRVPAGKHIKASRLHAHLLPQPADT